MKLYSYSSELHTFLEVKWAIAKLATGGILIWAIILFGFIKLNQFADNSRGSRSANTLVAENEILRRQLSLMLPRVGKLEMQANQLNERANKLQMLLHRRNIVETRFEVSQIQTKGFKLQAMIPATASFRP